MTARILIVDDVPVNLRLLGARLAAEYYEVVTATSGAEALAICDRQAIDIVLLDVMMPDMDGFEVCRRLKANRATAHLPVVMITALDEASDRRQGLEAGADDFLTKPVRDLPLFARIRSLARLKLTTDELQRRASTALDLMGDGLGSDQPTTPARVACFSADPAMARKLVANLKRRVILDGTDQPDEFMALAAGPVDAVLIDMEAEDVDTLRLLSRLRSDPSTRLLPILAIVASEDDTCAARALELGASDYVSRPVDRSELQLRLATMIRRRSYEDRLRQSIERTLELAVSDSLTGLHNRRFLDMHLERALAHARRTGETVGLMMADIDHFKRINDGWGHAAGDGVLKDFAGRLTNCLRASDLGCRFGGEEFAVLMPGADAAAVIAVADRVRRSVADKPFDVTGELLSITVSLGIAVFDPIKDDAAGFMRRADAALYDAKRSGRNRVSAAAA